MPPESRQRIAGVALALLFEAMLVAVLLTLGISKPPEQPKQDALVTITATNDEAEAPKPEQQPDKPASAARAVPQPRPEKPQPAPPTPPPALIPVRPDAMQQFDISRVAPAKPAAPEGPANTPYPGDSERIAGSGPHGEALYRARWYREPSHDELAGYLSTASGPGWALINCQTAPQFRVENCELVAEAPQGAGLGRAVLAAAWQFKVRPPQIGGRPQVGAWVRIRIEYTISEAPPPAWN